MRAADGTDHFVVVRELIVETLVVIEIDRLHGRKELRLEDGRAVRFIGGDTYQIEATGELLTRS